MAERPELTTCVAHAGWDEHSFCGHRLFEELAGTDGLWSLLSLASGGPRLDARAASVLDDIAACLAVADPRIWPLKITRLAAAYGGGTPALSAGLLLFCTSWVGTRPIVDAAAGLAGLARELGERAADPAAVAGLVRSRLASGERFAGFGVPSRPRDERVEALRRCLIRRGEDGGKHWRMLTIMAGVMEEEKGLPLNIAGASAAACLDLGLDSHQLHGLPVAFLLTPFIANALEGASQAPGLLRRLPEEWLDYRGPPPRLSPRSRGQV